MQELFGAVTALLTGPIREFDDGKKAFFTGYMKTPTDDQLWLDDTGLSGDFQADTRHHGGLDKAVLVYGESSYAFWRDGHKKELGFGAFGENLVVSVWDESNVCIGDRFRIGEGSVEVAQPRQPCWKIGAVLGDTAMLKAVLESGRTGWYLRVLSEGYLQRGMTVKLLERPHPEWTIIRANDVMRHKKERPEEVAALLKLPELAEAWKKDLA
jgi:MOSC domain-containing protein YiiM